MQVTRQKNDLVKHKRQYRAYIEKLSDYRYYIACMDNGAGNAILGLQRDFGERLRQLRIAKSVDQVTVAERAGVSLRAVRNLETGRGSSVETLLRYLRALDSLTTLDALAPQPTVNPLSLLPHARERKRVRRSKKREA